MFAHFQVLGIRNQVFAALFLIFSIGLFSDMAVAGEYVPEPEGVVYEAGEDGVLLVYVPGHAGVTLEALPPRVRALFMAYGQQNPDASWTVTVTPDSFVAQDLPSLKTAPAATEEKVPVNVAPVQYKEEYERLPESYDQAPSEEDTALGSVPLPLLIVSPDTQV